MGAYDIDAGVVADPFGPSVELQPLPPAADAEAAPALGGLAAGERESVKQRYERAAYAQLGVDPGTFAAMACAASRERAPSSVTARTSGT